MICDTRLSSKDNIHNMLRIISKQKCGLKIVHINAQSLNNKMDELRYIFISSTIDIICVSETWFHVSVSDSIYGIPGYNLFRADRQSHAGGSCIYVRNGIKCSLKLKSEYGDPIEYLFIEVLGGYNDKILLGSVYRPHRNVQMNALLSSLESLTVFYNDIIIGGDFNSNLLTDNNLINSMRMMDLVPVNTTNPTHFHHTSCSLLDIFFVNRTSKILLYDQLSACTFSNHDLICIIYEINVDLEDDVVSFRDFKYLDYNTLTEVVDQVH